MFWRRLLSCTALFIVLLSPVKAQNSEDTSPLTQKEKEQKALELKKELERKTFALLDEIIGSVSTLKLPENRALIQSSAADLLWSRDEKRARTLFKDALANLSSIAVKFDTQMSDDQRRAYWMFTQQRQAILQTIARRDVEMALELFRASRSQSLTPVGAAKDTGLLDQELRLERSLAIQVAASDPKRAFQMAEDSLAKGLSFELLQLLSQLNGKDRELAERLAADIIARLRSENLARHPEAAWLAAMLLRTSMIKDDGGNASLVFGGSGSGGGSRYKLSEDQLRDLLEIVTAAALSPTPNDALFSALPSMMPEIERRLPDRAPQLRRRISDYGRTVNPETRMYFEYQELTEHGSIEAIMEAAAKAPDKARTMLYEQAAWKTFQKGDADRAREIINANVRDSTARERMLEGFDRKSLWNSARKEKISEVRQMLTRIKSKLERAGILAQLAWGAAVKKDRKLALELLNEAIPLISLKPKSDEQLYIVLQVAHVYSLVEPGKAFEMIESLVDQANDLLSAASVLNGFFLPSGVFRKGELVLPTGYSNVSARFGEFGKEIGALAFVTFERTKAAADRFQRNEARIMARLFIAQGVLSQQLGSGAAFFEGVMALNY